MKEINLNNLQLKTFTEQDVLDYCQINNINPDNITELYLSFNQLTDISGIRLFKNVNTLSLNNNKIKNISVLKYLKNLEHLNLERNQLTNISVLKDLTNLKQLNIGNNKIKNISGIKYLFNIKYLDIRNLNLKSDQIQYIDFFGTLEYLWCDNGFKHNDILNKLNNNINII